MDKTKNEGISLIESQLLKSLVDFSGINTSTSVLIKNIESFSEFVVVFLSKSVFPAGSFRGGGGRCLNLRSAHWIEIK
jgi:hypothetical protein